MENGDESSINPFEGYSTTDVTPKTPQTPEEEAEADAQALGAYEKRINNPVKATSVVPVGQSKIPWAVEKALADGGGKVNKNQWNHPSDHFGLGKSGKTGEK